MVRIINNRGTNGDNGSIQNSSCTVTQIIQNNQQLLSFLKPWFQVFLKSDRVSRMVQSGGCSASDSREVFKKHIEKRVRSLPEIDGLSKETVLSSWMAKFDTIYRGEEDPRKHQQRMTASAASELILSKDQLYEMFQQILGIKKFEHQLLYNACQVSPLRFFTYPLNLNFKIWCLMFTFLITFLSSVLCVHWLKYHIEVQRSASKW